MSEDGELSDDGLEYIKASEHAGGKQFWYKDKDGRIHEKDSAPEGHPDNEMGGDGAVQQLAAKVDEMAQKVDKIYEMEMGEQDHLEGEEGHEEMSEEGKEEGDERIEDAGSQLSDQEQEAPLPEPTMEEPEQNQPTNRS